MRSLTLYVMSTTDYMEHDGAANGHGALANGAAPPVGPLRRPLSQAALRRVASVVVQLAGRAQYSKARPLGCAEHTYAHVLWQQCREGFLREINDSQLAGSFAVGCMLETTRITSGRLLPNCCIRSAMELMACMYVRQDNNLMSMACFSLSQAAYLAPDLVLPLVHQRFEVRPCKNTSLPFHWHT